MFTTFTRSIFSCPVLLMRTRKRKCKFAPLAWPTGWVSYVDAAFLLFRTKSTVYTMASRLGVKRRRIRVGARPQRSIVVIHPGPEGFGLLARYFHDENFVKDLER